MAKNLTPEQEEIVDDNGSAAIIASPGSGKTTVLAEKIAHLARRGTDLERILVVTFTEKAARELQGRVAKSPPIGTIHAFFAGLIRRWGGTLGLGSDFDILDETLADLFRRQSLQRSFEGLVRERDPLALDFVAEHEFHGALRHALHLLTTRPSDPAPPLARRLREAYQSDKREARLLDFQDLETLGLQILRDAALGERIASSFDWILVDEFQDTSRSQWEMLQLLYRPQLNRLVVVGDPRQSIYRFRGANPDFFWQAIRSIEETGGKVFYLDHNFRSCPALIRYLNRITPSLFPDCPRPLVATRPATADGGVEILPFDAPAEAARRRQMEASHVADKITSLTKGGVPLSDMALLFRTHRAIRTFEQTFHRRRIPCSVSHDLLLDQPEVASAIWQLRALFDPNDPLPPVALETTPLSPRPDVAVDLSHPEGLDRWFDHLHQELGKRPEAERYLSDFKGLLLRLLRLNLTPLDLIRALESIRRDKVRLHPSPTQRPPVGVQLLTVHAAKGLEFPSIFLCDLPATPSRKGRGGERDAEEEERESRRLLYVALTRARDRVFLPLPRSPARPARDSWMTLFAQPADA